MDMPNFEALFLGPQAENHRFFKELLNFMVDEHIHWRRNFHPEDSPAVSLADQQGAGFRATWQKVHEVLLALSAKLKNSSMPWHSPRYLGHMNADILMPAVLAYVSTLLYNPNNVASEASPATTVLELDVGEDFARLMGYDPQRAWGHITSGGHVANYEALWVARNLKSIPLALNVVLPNVLPQRDTWALLNMPGEQILDLLDVISEQGDDVVDLVRAQSVRGKGLRNFDGGRVLVPQSRHYSWAKAVDVLGLGQESLITVKVTDTFRMDMADLHEKLTELANQRIPVLAVIGVVGSTEEGAVDEVDKIVELRCQLQKQAGLSFSIHVDAAYGGYARAILLNEQQCVMEHAALQNQLDHHNVIAKDYNWPQPEVYRAFKELSAVDSVTIDPHKMGYVPYQAGGIVFKDKRVRRVISYFAPYLFEQKAWEKNPPLLGSFILEGSKAGAAAAAVWAAHRCVPLNINGYGRIIGESIEGALRLYEAFLAQQWFAVERDGRTYKVLVAPLTKPDLNIVVYAFNFSGNASLQRMNALNEAIRAEFSYKGGVIHAKDFIVSSTRLTAHEYGDAPLAFLQRLGIPEHEWRERGEVVVLRSCILTPYLTRDYTDEDYAGKFIESIHEKLQHMTLCPISSTEHRDQ